MHQTLYAKQIVVEQFVAEISVFCVSAEKMFNLSFSYLCVPLLTFCNFFLENIE